MVTIHNAEAQADQIDKSIPHRNESERQIVSKRKVGARREVNPI